MPYDRIEDYDIFQAFLHPLITVDKSKSTPQYDRKAGYHADIADLREGDIELPRDIVYTEVPYEIG